MGTVTMLRCCYKGVRPLEFAPFTYLQGRRAHVGASASLLHDSVRQGNPADQP